MKEKILTGLLLLMLILLFLAQQTNGQTRVDSLTVKPDTIVELDLIYPLIEGAVFNDVVSFRGETSWADTNGFSMIYVDRSAKIISPFENWLGSINDSEDQVASHQFIFAAAGVVPIRVSDDITVAKAKFMSPGGMFEPVTLTVLTELMINESTTRYFHAWKITVDPNLGVSSEQPEDFNLGISAELYPNPNPQQLDLKIDIPSQTLVTVIDILGRQREILYNSFLADGTLVKLSLSHLESGTYFLMTSTKTGNQIKKFLIRK